MNDNYQERSQNLKEVPQNFTEVFSSIVCEVIATVFFFIKHTLNLKYTKQ